MQGRPDAAGPNPNAGSLYEQFQNSLAAQGPPSEDAHPHTKPVKLTLWSGGTFSIDDDESEIVQRNPATDPAAAQLIDDVKRGIVPEELRRKYGDKIDLSIENRSQDAFEVKPRPMKAFSGSGRRLGDVVPTVTGVSDASSDLATKRARVSAGLTRFTPLFGTKSNNNSTRPAHPVPHLPAYTPAASLLPGRIRGACRRRRRRSGRRRRRRKSVSAKD